MATKIEASWINNLYTALKTTLPNKGFTITGTIPTNCSVTAGISRTTSADVTNLINALNNQKDNEFFSLIKQSSWPISTTSPSIAQKQKIAAGTKTAIDTKINEMLSMYANYGQTTYTTYTHYAHYNKSGDSVQTPTGNSVNTGNAVNTGNPVNSGDGNQTGNRVNSGNPVSSGDGVRSGDSVNSGQANRGRTCSNNNGYKSHKGFWSYSDDRDASCSTHKSKSCSDCTNVRDTNNSYFATESDCDKCSNAGNSTCSDDSDCNRCSDTSNSTCSQDGNCSKETDCSKDANVSFTHQSNNSNVCSKDSVSSGKANYTKSPSPFA